MKVQNEDDRTKEEKKKSKEVSKDELAPEKRVRRFTSLYATHLLRINSLSGRLLPHVFFFSSFFSLSTVHSTTRIHNTNVPAWCRTRAGECSPPLNYRPYVFKWSAVCIFIKARVEARDPRHLPRPLESPLISRRSSHFRWPSTSRIYACLRKFPLVSVTRLQS